MTRVNIVVEGQTEETFVREVLAPHLGARGVFASARCVETRRKPYIRRGGLTSYAKAKHDLQRWLHQDMGAHVSTMFDMYALPGDFPQRDLPRPAGETPQQWAERLEQALRADLGDPRFIPYFQIHEFEALLFSDVSKIDGQLGTSPRHMAALRDIRAAFFACWLATLEGLGD